MHFFSTCIAILIAVLPFVATYDFSDAFTFPKWVSIYVFTSLAGLVFILFSKKLILPKFSVLTIMAVSTLVILTTINLLNNSSNIFQEAVLDRLSAVLLIYIFYVAFKNIPDLLRHINLCLVLSCLGVSVIGLASMVCHMDLVRWSLLPMRHTVFFGNVNMASEYLVCVLPFVFFSPYQHHKFLRVLRFISIATAIELLLAYQCRSALLAATVVSTVLLISLSKKQAAKFLVLQALAVATLHFSMPQIDRYLRINLSLAGETAAEVDAKETAAKENNTQQKFLSFQERLYLWEAAVRLIAKEPFGVGIGQFIFSSIPEMAKIRKTQNELLLSKSPHNEYLRILAEDGILFFLVAGFLLFYLWRKFFFSQPLQSSSQDKNLVASWFSFLFIQMLFQFPLENAIPLLFFTLMMGFILAKISDSLIVDSNFKIYFLLVFTIMVTVQILLTYRVSYANFLMTFNPTTHREPKQSDYAEACTLNPALWSACLMSGTAEYENHKMDSAQDIFSEELAKRPLNFLALKGLIYTHIAKKEIDKACVYAGYFDRIFRNKSSLNKFIDTRCVAHSESGEKITDWESKIIQSY